MKEKDISKDKFLQQYRFMIVHSRSMGFCVMERQDGFWQQITKWYKYYGNLRRYNKSANNVALYKVID